MEAERPPPPPPPPATPSQAVIARRRRTLALTRTASRLATRSAGRPAARPSLLALRGVGRVLALSAGAARRTPPHARKSSPAITARGHLTVEEALVEVPALAAGAAKAFFAATTARSPAAALLGASVTGMLAAYWVLELAHALLWPACFALIGLMVFAPGFARWLLLEAVPAASQRLCRAVSACRLAAEAAAAEMAEETEGELLAAAAAATAGGKAAALSLEGESTTTAAAAVAGAAAPRGDAPTVLLPMNSFALIADTIPLGDACISAPATSCQVLGSAPGHSDLDSCSPTRAADHHARRGPYHQPVAFL